MKKVKLKLVGLDGNAFAIMGQFQRQARSEGWSQAEIKEVLDKAMSGDYSNLVSTIAEHCTNPL
jgi:ERCC4-related helicase